jgi:hypothetical protein
MRLRARWKPQSFTSKKESDMNINYTRVLLGGLLAGVVLNVGEFLFNEILFKSQLEEFMRRLNVPPIGSTFLTVAVLLTFALGIVIVLLYAMIRPCYGPGPKTAICAGLIAWFFACIYCGIIYGVILGVPINLAVLGLVWCLIEYCIAAIAGAWVYRERGVPAT